MKRLLAFCLAVYLIAEVSAKPSPQSLDTATDFFNKVKVKVQEALDQAREAATSAMDTARTALQEGFHSVQQAAQTRLEPGEQSTRSEPEVMDQNGA